ncbi:VIT1/CCC1 transporter family protein [Chelatococcus asaccharovorans]|uniref:VIT1/CCC1 family predicted Fe2+/Mn2+ transporter n=1 Tax=Chelatococcus asaccharovorans TaxID=28210 RepID=A0A2V3U4K5_9HYPH|nr:VIT family protein [Chelatococcus asaccharovorans]MBS7702637.1 VIT family protein [Chelatococcus asaccharovorans]PXW52239.1 VIT1/CCC1 family predicted Fe2+/Mn2+ transporter [Chelatococcus asaccharovorans]
MFHPHRENHLVERIGWLRAAVLGANDGIISTASLVVGVAAAATAPSEIIVAGIAGMIAGAMSMAAGEYVSVSSQADTERADLARERRELAADPRGEEEELAQIYVGRGLAPALAREVAVQLMAHDALEAHARDELGITATATARPVQAALASATTFTTGAIVPILAAIASPASMVVPVVFAVSVALLALLGALGARAGGASLLKPTLRVALWGALAMAVTAGIGALIGKAV